MPKITLGEKPSIVDAAARIAGRYRRSLSSVVAGVALALAMAPAEARLVCEEIVAERACSDSSPKTYQVAPGQNTLISAPVLSGYSSACWVWTRSFQCVESDPIYSCDSGTAFNTVKSTCSLTDATILSTITLNGLSYILSADYDYRCAFGPGAVDQQLPLGKDCVLLESNTVESDYVAAAPSGAAPSTGTGTPPTTAALSSQVSTTQTQTDDYVCYSPPVTTCADTCYESRQNPATGTMEQVAVPCESPVTNCVAASDQCNAAVASDGTSATGTLSTGPDGRCVSSVKQSMCQSGPIPKCLASDQCTLTSTQASDIQDNGVAMTQQQTYTCANDTTTCTKLAEVSDCFHVTAWGFDQGGVASQLGSGLGEATQALAKVDGIEKGMAQEDPYIFSGQSRKCHYAIGNFLNFAIMAIVTIVVTVYTGGLGTGLVASAIGPSGAGLVAASTAANIQTAVTLGSVANSFFSDAKNSKAFGSDCCKEWVIEGSDAWYKMGKCTLDEVKLAVARRKGLTHYLGEYCSKKSGFPIKQCVEKTKSYCTFDDMLALVVNEQGRAQLEAVAAADTASTLASPDQRFNFYAPLVDTGAFSTRANGSWVKLTTFNKSQVWYWQYAGYCRSIEAQQAAYQVWLDEIAVATDTKGKDPAKFTKDEAAAYIKKLAGLPIFQECPETAGTMSFMTCSLQNDSCDASKLPSGPTGVETDLTGAAIGTADLNWRIQQIDAFKYPGDYGVTALMPNDASFAAMSDSLNQYVTSIGSCHQAAAGDTGPCLFNFSVTDKQATGGLGARKRTKETVGFPLYAFQSYSQPAIDYISKDGTLNTTEYNSDPNKGLGQPVTVSTQRFIFHPITKDLMPRAGENIHQAILLEWAHAGSLTATPQSLFGPVVVPTSLPPSTAGFWPYGTASDNKSHFYLDGGCDPNSRWCSYNIQVDLDVPRHPWGSAESPRCWGFSVEQMAALDFDKMDLSRWIDSLNLGGETGTGELSADMAKAMNDQAVSTAQSFYTAMTTGGKTNSPNAGKQALTVNTNVVPLLSSTEDSSYTVRAGVPANWPQWFDNGSPNNNPVTNVKVDWGDGTPVQSFVQTGDNMRAWIGTHDYGDNPVGNYTLTVTLDTAFNGSQKLSTVIRITPDSGKAPTADTLNFSAGGLDGKAQAEYAPSLMQNGSKQDTATLETLSPGSANMATQQGTSVK